MERETEPSAKYHLRIVDARNLPGPDHSHATPAIAIGVIKMRHDWTEEEKRRMRVQLPDREHEEYLFELIRPIEGQKWKVKHVALCPRQYLNPRGEFWTLQDMLTMNCRVEVSYYIADEEPEAGAVYSREDFKFGGAGRLVVPRSAKSAGE